MAARLGQFAHVLETRAQRRFSVQWQFFLRPRVCNVIHGKSYSDDSKDDDGSSSKSRLTEKDAKSEEQLTPKQVAALDKLNSLLKTMKVSRPTSSLDLAKPTQRLKEAEKKLKMEQEKREREARQAEKPERKDTIASVLEDGDLDPNIVHAVKDVASSLGGDTETIETELITKLREHGSRDASADKINLSDVFVGMKIERSKQKSDSRQYPVSSRMFQQSESNDRRSQTGYQNTRTTRSRQELEARPRIRSKIDLFGSGTLNIFSRSDLETEDTPDFPQLKLWDRLDQKELQLQILHPPKNAYEEMILWTKQDKFWKFPIDNEAGLDEEAKVSFHEHIFLDHLLDEGFPKKGPVRHFMELVTTGLSKNPYLTVQQKHDHVTWFRDYFKDKEDILKAVGAN